ncbi:Methyltransferase domain-containing protein [Singulisphaera sp. GP187]|uniref:class I SAM-dependent methyltransferase n=1 Tax=Singulisphaera sp. GP187 TaxID=1882752 RepID=UPI0009269DDF|nr:methyltransferase domain-containing protein [Singulisphaera sp. GP187]SIO64921.1 Methyltransferase domain-containing protein [Singulisphaera sp. GP187]
MRHTTLLFMSLVTGGMMGCKKPRESAAPVVENSKVAEQVPEQEQVHIHGGHEHHHHGFDDPTKFENQWNAPERDRWQHPEEIIAALALSPGATVADIGAGTGYMVAHLSKAVGDRGTVIAIDAAPAMITYLTNRSADLGPAKIVPQQVSGESPELPDDRVDGAITVNTWHHINERETYAKKVYSGLKRGGKFVVVDSEVDAESGPPKAMRLEAGRVMQDLEAGGFRVVIAHESMPQHYMIVGHKD